MWNSKVRWPSKVIFLLFETFWSEQQVHFVQVSSVWPGWSLKLEENWWRQGLCEKEEKWIFAQLLSLTGAECSAGQGGRLKRCTNIKCTLAGLQGKMWKKKKKFWNMKKMSFWEQWTWSMQWSILLLNQKFSWICWSQKTCSMLIELAWPANKQHFASF